MIITCSVIIEIEGTRLNDVKLVQSYFSEYLRIQGYDVLSILNDNTILVLIPSSIVKGIIRMFTIPT